MTRAALITARQRAQLLANGQRSRRGGAFDPWPVVKLFTPEAHATFLLTELDLSDPDIAFGLCDLGLGSPELGSVRLTELSSIRGHLKLPVERDRSFIADRTLSAYADAARTAGRITA